MGPYPVLRVDGKQVYIIVNDKEFQHSIHKVLSAKEYDKVKNGNQQRDVLYEMMNQFTYRKMTSKLEQYDLSLIHI